MNESNKPVFPEVVFRNGTEWRLIPGYIAVYAGSNGIITRLNNQGDLIQVPTKEWKTTKGSYKYAKVITEKYTAVDKAIHQLVTLAFHGKPPNDGAVYEPNHKNMDKHDNRPSNLEWMTRRHNVQHAYDSGNTLAGLRVTAVDSLTGKETNFPTLSSMARQLEIPRHQLLKIVANHRSIPWRNQWTFIIDDTSDSKIDRYVATSVVFKDYVTGKVTVASDTRKAMFLTGVLDGTIRYRVNVQKTSVKYLKLLSRYVFQKANDLNEWPVFTPEEALESERLYEQCKRPTLPE